MKNLVKNFTANVSMIVFCLLFGFSLMSFQSVENIELVQLEESTCPTASFSVQNNGCTGPCEITFINQSLNATSYHWNFGDGNESNEANVSHTYEEEGTYTVTLTAIVGGCTHDFIGTVDIISG